MTSGSFILLVEDDEDDVLLICGAFEKARITDAMAVVRSGAEAMAYLAGRGKYGNREEYPLPQVVLLDLKMEGVDGFEVLGWIRARPELKSLWVVVLTNSMQLRDVNLAYGLGASSYLVKPIDFEKTVELARMVKRGWLLEQAVAPRGLERRRRVRLPA